MHKRLERWQQNNNKSQEQPTTTTMLCSIYLCSILQINFFSLFYYGKITLNEWIFSSFIWKLSWIFLRKFHPIQCYILFHLFFLFIFLMYKMQHYLKTELDRFNVSLFIYNHFRSLITVCVVLILFLLSSFFFFNLM